MCEPVHISLAFRCLQLLLKNVGYTGRLLLRSSPDSAATSAAPERHKRCCGPHDFTCSVGRLALPSQPYDHESAEFVGNFGKQRRRSCFVTPSAGLAFSNTFSKPMV